MRTLLESERGKNNDTRLEEIAKEAKEIMDGIKDIKTLLESESGQTNDTMLEEIAEIAKDIKDEISNVKQLLAPRPIELDAWSPSKQALVCEYLCL